MPADPGCRNHSLQPFRNTNRAAADHHSNRAAAHANVATADSRAY